MSERRGDDVAVIHASFERMMADLEGRLVTPDTMHATMQTTAQKNGASVQTPARKTAATNADNDMRGSQLQTALDRGDYGTQAEAIGDQAEETHRKAEVDKDPAGNQTGSIEYDHNDNRYVLAQKAAAAVEAFAPDLAAALRKRADMVGPPMGGEPGSVTEGRESAMGGDDPVVGGEPPPDVATGPSTDGNLQQAIQQALEEQKQANDSLQKAQMEADSARTVVEKLQAAAAGTSVSDSGKSAAKKSAAAAETTDTLPGHGSRVDKSNFSARSIQPGSAKPPTSGDPDDQQAALARSQASGDKSAEGPGHTAPSDRQSQRDPGGYPLKGASKNGVANGVASKGAQVQTTPQKTAAASAPPVAPKQAAAPAKKTAEATDDIQPQSPISAPTDYSGDDAGDAGELPEIDAGTTPTLESAETRRVADEGNREVSSESSSSMQGSVSAALKPIFSKQQREKLMVECKAIDAAQAALRTRIAHARQILVQGEEVAKTASVRADALKKCGDAIEAVLKKADLDEASGAKLRTATLDVVRLGRREVVEARREMGYLGAALIEAKRSREREARLAPAFSLAIAQLQSNMLSADELPAKVAEYLTMDGRTFETVARIVEETGARARHAMRAARTRTATRIPNVPEDPIARPKDDLDGIFGDNYGRDG